LIVEFDCGVKAAVVGCSGCRGYGVVAVIGVACSDDNIPVVHVHTVTKVSAAISAGYHVQNDEGC